MFQTTKKAANYFIALQYAQVTQDEEDASSSTMTHPGTIYPGANSAEFNTITGGLGFKKKEIVGKTIFHRIGMQDMATV